MALRWRFCTAWCVLLKNPCKICAKPSAIFPQRAFFLAKNQVEWESGSCRTQKHREGLFLLLCLAAAGVCAGLAFPVCSAAASADPQTLPDTKALAAYTQVELNTADADALCTLPGVGPAMHRPSWTTGRSTVRLHRWRMPCRCRALPAQWWIHGQDRRMSARAQPACALVKEEIRRYIVMSDENRSLSTAN